MTVGEGLVGDAAAQRDAGLDHLRARLLGRVLEGDVGRRVTEPVEENPGQVVSGLAPHQLATGLDDLRPCLVGQRAAPQPGVLEAGLDHLGARLVGEGHQLTGHRAQLERREHVAVRRHERDHHALAVAAAAHLRLPPHVGRGGRGVGAVPRCRRRARAGRTPGCSAAPRPPRRPAACRGRAGARRRRRTRRGGGSCAWPTPPRRSAPNIS